MREPKRQHRRISAAAALLAALTILSVLTPSGAGADPVAPSAPQNLAVTPGDRTATLSWDTPSSDGGAPIVVYWACAHRQLPSAADTCRDVDASLTSVILPGLYGGLHYSFAVRAVTMATHSEWAAIEGDLAPSAAEPPETVDSNTSARSVAVEWAAPAYDGGSPLTGFRACAVLASAPSGTPKCVNAGAAATTAKITGLTPHVGYQVDVAAINAKGTGATTASDHTDVPFDLPAAPGNVTATAGVHEILVSWDAPDDGGSGLTGYVLTPYLNGKRLGSLKRGAGTDWLLTGMTAGRDYRFEVAAENAGGIGPVGSTATTTTVRSGATPYAPFASWDLFVSEQLVDTTGQRGTTDSRASAVAALTAGTTTPENYIKSVLGGAAYQKDVPPIVRLYRTYFGRIPDAAGLLHWTGARRSGTTLIRVSTKFAASSEFKRTYGSLSNAAFVDLVYHNVLGRPGDAGGRSYWIGKLNRGTPRGQVMVNFSESSEYVRTTRAVVEVIGAYESLMHRAPSANDVADFQSQDLSRLALFILDSDQYAERHR